MSWDQYVDNLKAGGFAKAAICGLDGSVWAYSTGFNVQPTEVTTMCSGFTNRDVLTGAGIVVAGEKYFYITSDETQIQGKKGTSGVCIAKSIQCVLIGVYNEPIQPGQARTNIEKLRDHLQLSNY